MKTSVKKAKLTSRSPHLLAFTLIELLVVISIIALLAALTVPVLGAVSKHKYRRKATTELHALAAQIDRYKAKMGHYPPDNPGKPGLNQLYYELAGTTNSTSGTVFGTVDHSAAITTTDIQNFFGQGMAPPPVAGFVNCSKSTGDEAAPAQRFLGDLKAGELMDVKYSGYSGAPVKMLVCPVPGADPNALPLLDANSGQPVTASAAPWCYNSTNPTNNPGSYDLWVDIIVGGKTNRICNWSATFLVLQ